MHEQSLPTIVPELPPEVVQAIQGKDSGTTSTLLSIYRTRLGVRRTGLADLRSHLANERTHLAYVRTAISLISFGITLNRFAVFLEQKGTLRPGEGSGHVLRDTGNIGVGMVVLGLILAAWSLYRYRRVGGDIRDSTFRPMDRAVYIMTVLLIVLGGFSAVWLFLI